MDFLVENTAALLPLVLTVVITALMLWLVNRLFTYSDQSLIGHRFTRQLVMIALGGAGIVAVVLSLPVDDSLRSQLLGLIGLVFTGIVAFSSTTFVANIMAGLMLRSVRSFNRGDFIESGEFFGKVTELGLFHTEIQSEDRDLITLPNFFLVTKPIKVVRTSGTALNCSLSLGYDIPRTRVEALLKQAALDAGLEDPFVQIVELGDFSVTYKAVGFYRNVEHLLSTRSAFKGAILDALHGEGIEIVSPAFMNQRQLDVNKPVIPAGDAHEPEVTAAEIFPEALLFDKANRAQRIQMLEEKGAALRDQLEKIRKAEGRKSTEDDAERRHLESQINVSKILLEREQAKDEE